MTGAPDIAAERHEAYEIVPGAVAPGLIVLCDHASNHIPEDYANLGLPPGDLQRHIAWDIGAAGVARRLAAMLGAPAVLSRFSRLLADPNRGLDDPTLIMRLSDGTIIPGNAQVDAAERQRRIERFWRPYDDAVSGLIDRFTRAGVGPALISIHSFTPAWRGVRRPWHAGLLYDPRDPRFSLAVKQALERDPELVVGDNQPYSGGLSGDMMDRQGFRRRLDHALIEVRQDLVDTEAGQEEWAARIAKAVRHAMATARRDMPRAAQ